MIQWLGRLSSFLFNHQVKVNITDSACCFVGSFTLLFLLFYFLELPASFFPVLLDLLYIR
jgi:hypothetical protein